MKDSGKAVFLSYASQDAEAARRLCEALRAAGVEVWFDQSELRGGDSWDQKIRRQIKECTLFVPVISANTQARPEGYFRLEWKLAVDRSHLMADDQPFIVPVVIDDTSEPAARVPDRFRDVQWTRLVLAESPDEFAARLRMLMADAKSEPPQGRIGAEVPRQRREARADARPRGWRWWMIFPIGGLLVGLAGALRPIWTSNRPRVTKDERPGVAAPVAISEARQLAAKAKALYEPWDGATREDFALAEHLLKRATDLDPTDGEVWAEYGLTLCGQMVFGHDRSPARLELTRSVTERAVKLAPDSDRARFAQAYYFRFNLSTRPQAERILRELVERMPKDKLVLRTLGAALRNENKIEEALQYFDRAAALPGGDPVAEYNKFLTLRRAGRHSESEGVIDRALVSFQKSYLYRAKVACLVELHGNLDAAAETLAKVAPEYLLEDTGMSWASQVWLWRREPEKCLAVVRPVSRDIIEGDFGGPKAYISGVAHRIAGRNEAAEIEWRTALQVVERQLAVEPNVARWFYWKAYLLALLGRVAEAEPVLRSFEQLAGLTGLSEATLSVYLRLGRRDEVLAFLEKLLARTSIDDRDAFAIFSNTLRYDPSWDPLRGDPRFERLLSTASPKSSPVETRN